MILALSYVLAVFLTHLGAISSELNTYQLTLKANQPEVSRTISESNFILSDYGVWFEPRKLSRKDRLALALTNLAETGQ